LLISSGAIAEEKWQTVGTGQVLVKTRPVKGSQVQEIWAETNLSASVRDLQDTLLDGESFPRFMPYTKAVKKLGATEPDGTWLVHTVVTPPIVEPRDYIVRVGVDRSVAPDGSGDFENHWVVVPSKVPLTKGWIRMSVNEGRWIVTPLPNGQSHVVYRFRIDPGGWIPPWLADLGNRSGINDIFKAVEIEAKRRGAARAADAGTSTAKK
jgi:hypothetical protein